MPSSDVRQVRVWDLPTRIFHWSLALLVAVAFLTGWKGGNAMDWHGRAGVAIAGLLAFRLTWGLIGSTHARFVSFVRGPAAIRSYLRGQWQGLGHNPLGALSVLAMLTTLGFQVGSGLFGNDDIAFNGPLYRAVSKNVSDLLTGLHRLNVWVIVALVAAHVGAIVFYLRARGENLVRPMVTGIKETSHPVTPPRGGGFLAFAIALAVALGTAWAASGALLPPPAPAAETPNW